MAPIHPTRNPWQVTHGCAHTGGVTPEYRAWANLLQRCYNARHANFHLYGGRGVRVCPRWRASFANFWADMGPRPSPAHSIDRFPDQHGNYEPGNCRWATQKQQMRNMSRNRLVTFRGETLCLAAWSERLGFGRGVLRCRLKALSVEEALTRPVKPKGRQTCSVEGCAGLCFGRGLCGKHYQRRRKGRI